MNLDQKRERCFETLLPEAFRLIHEIHYEEARGLNDSFDAIRKAVRDAKNNGTKIDFSSELVPKIMHLVERVVNYRDFIKYVDDLKASLPVHSINFIGRNNPHDDQRIKEFKEAVDLIEKHAGNSINFKTEIGRKIEEAMKSITMYAVNTETKIVPPAHNNCEFSVESN